MILPSKHPPQDRALLTVGAHVLTFLACAKTVSARWKEVIRQDAGLPATPRRVARAWNHRMRKWPCKKESCLIRHIFSTLPTFNSLEDLKPGLNVLLAKKTEGATTKKTRNRSGTSSFVELVHFLLGSDVGPESIFRTPELAEHTFGMDFDLKEESMLFERSGSSKAKLFVTAASAARVKFSATGWRTFLGEQMFGLRSLEAAGSKPPSFRSLFAYFARRQASGAFMTPEKQGARQGTDDMQMALMFLLGLDLQIARDWQDVRDREKNLDELKKAGGKGAFGSIRGKAADLRTELIIQEARLKKLHSGVETFQVAYRDQGELGRLESEVESLRQRFEAAEQLEGTKNELEIERNRLTIRLRRDFTEQKDRLAEAIFAFEDTSRRLYESAGSMTFDVTTNGPVFKFPMQGARSKGIKNMQIFCFDMMLMRLCHKRKTGPGFLIHDSHLFDGVDGRQVISALRLGSEIAQELGFQYIVTMNEDDAFKETIEGFDLNDHVLPIRLTDATEDGGLFGIRF